ncbi:MAG: hypothetical protein EBU46_09375 [Nitrosomonadaceae bacterium]|nr:hypothetical protein [Nitrosomonadaceae bacterium]
MNKNKTTLIIPDVHLRYPLVTEIIKHEGCDEVVFLGDFFDQFHDTPAENRKQALWLKAEMKKPNRRFIWGNHDIHYRNSTNRQLISSGYESAKDVAINDIMESSDWAKFVYYIWLDGNWLLTHGGLHPYHIPLILKDPKTGSVEPLTLTKWLDAEVKAAERAIIMNEGHWIFQAGYCRGGNKPKGGLTWLDFNEEFEPIAGINQLVGHTNQFRTWLPKEKSKVGSINYCIDADNKFYAVHCNGKIDIREIPEHFTRWQTTGRK